VTRRPSLFRKRYLLLLIPAIGLIPAAGSIRPLFADEVSTYSEGASVYSELGCGACHESVVLGPIPRERKPAPHVFEHWIDTGDLSEAVRFGGYKPKNYAVAQRSIPRKITMPAYVDWISDSDLRALSVFLQVNQLVNMRSKSEGQMLARKYGCFDCHGPLGLGGVVNPRSFKGYIPGWFGSDFDELTNGGNREIVAEWIRSGTSSFVTAKSFGRGAIARHFGENQVIKMPPFKRRMPIEDLNLIVDYVLLLRSFGDMNLAEVDRYKTLYAVEPKKPNT
jgi:mono/diheme cytochrome c family protein